MKKGIKYYFYKYRNSYREKSKSIDVKESKREQWSSKLDFIFSCIGFAIGMIFLLLKLF